MPSTSTRASGPSKDTVKVRSPACTVATPAAMPQAGTTPHHAASSHPNQRIISRLYRTSLECLTIAGFPAAQQARERGICVRTLRQESTFGLEHPAFFDSDQGYRKKSFSRLMALYIVSTIIEHTTYRETIPHERLSEPACGRSPGRATHPACGRDPLHHRIPAATGLARQRQRQPGLFPGWTDPEHLGQADRQLLAQPCLPRGHRPGAPPGRPAYP